MTQTNGPLISVSDAESEMNDSNLPDDLPSDVPAYNTQTTSARVQKNINFSSPEESAEFLSETGRYAVSASRKIYEYGNDKYLLVTQ